MTGLSQKTGSYVQFNTLLRAICKMHPSDILYTHS